MLIFSAQCTVKPVHWVLSKVDWITSKVISALFMTCDCVRRHCGSSPFFRSKFRASRLERQGDKSRFDVQTVICSFTVPKFGVWPYCHTFLASLGPWVPRVFFCRCLSDGEVVLQAWPALQSCRHRTLARRVAGTCSSKCVRDRKKKSRPRHYSTALFRALQIFWSRGVEGPSGPRRRARWR